MGAVAGSDGEGINSEGGGYGVSGGNVVEGVALRWRYRGAIHRQGVNMVAGIGCDVEGLVVAVVNRGVVRRYRAVGAGIGGDGEGIDSEGGGYGMSVGNAVEGVALCWR